MKKSAINKMYMYETVLQTCNKYSEAWSGFPAFVSSVEKFNLELEHLWSLAPEQKHPLTNFRKEKAQLRAKLVDNYRMLREIVRMHAMQVDNYELMLAAAPHKSKMLNSREIDCIALCRSFAAALESVLPELEAFNITQAKLDAFLSKIEAFETAVATPRNAIVARRVLTERIDEKVREIDLHLRFNLDALVGLFKESHADFYEEYHFSRKIVHYANKKVLRGEGNTKDKSTPERDDGI